MIEQITPSYKFTCDRCGKEKMLKPGSNFPNVSVSFVVNDGFKYARKEGDVCIDCLKEFNELAENFFSEVNKETSDENSNL